MSILSPEMCRACAARLTLAVGLIPGAAAVADEAPHAVATDGPPAVVRDVEPGPGEAGDPPVRPLPPHLRAIQQSLGGSALDQFQSLEPGAAAGVPRPWWQRFRGAVEPATAAARDELPAGIGAPAWGPSSTAPVAPNSPVVAAAPAARTPNTRRTIGGLRAAAAQMEVAANRLEELELYRHADALRQQAQRMRVDARRIGAAASPRGSADQGPGADWQDPPESGYRRPPRGQGAASPSSFGPAEGDPPPAANWPMESGGSNGSDFRNRNADDERSVLIDPRAE